MRASTPAVPWRTAAALLAWLLPLGGAAAEIGARVVGEARASVLQVAVFVPAELAGPDGAWELRLPERYALQSAVGVEGEALDMQREGGRVVVRRPGGTAAGGMTLHYHWPLGRPLEQTRLTVGLGWLPVPRGAGPGVATTLAVSLPPGLAAVSTGRGRLESGEGIERFTWTDALANAAPLVVGRLGWRERSGSGRVLRVALPPELDARGSEILDLLEQTAADLRARHGASPARDFTLALVPLPGGRRGLSLPGLALAGIDGFPATGPLPVPELAGLLERDWEADGGSREAP